MVDITKVDVQISIEIRDQSSRMRVSNFLNN